MEIGAVGQGGQLDAAVQNAGSGKYKQGDGVTQSKAVKSNQDTLTLSTTTNNTDTIKKDNASEIKHAVEKLNTFLEDNSTHAVYEPNDNFKNVVTIKIVDDATGQVLQELPPKKILDMIAKMMEMVGVLFDKKA